MARWLIHDRRRDARDDMGIVLQNISKLVGCRATRHSFKAIIDGLGLYQLQRDGRGDAIADTVARYVGETIRSAITPHRGISETAIGIQL